ncbi:hypothetical protein QF034_003959 [Streptomyces africanus]|uniref:Uncharacterized protein n=1 Tax=Streptomyces africanus TaxID=231024 RepID=A0ABU0QQS2_9ACTN|nr:hypothetical protein [Streptomyces africanus]MDQ0749728.1 hypothetical protein [Streptomyces africanus]
MTTLLYYPLAKPPLKVVHEALLYWDGLASMVSERQETYERTLAGPLRDLMDRGFYNPISLKRHYRLLADREIQDFPGLVDELHAISPHRGRPVYLDSGGKIGFGLERGLVALGVARRSRPPERPNLGYLVLPEKALLVLAGTMAHEVARSTTSHSYTPYTDQQTADEVSLKPDYRKVTAWRVELGRMLPMPAPGTPTSEVLAFREKYASERERLVDATQVMLSELNRHWEHPADVLQRMRKELTQARADYQEAVKSSRMAWITRSVSVTVAMSTAAVGALVVPDFGWVAGIAGSIGFNIATREIRPVIQKKQEHPFSYLRLVEKELS